MKILAGITLVLLASGLFAMATAAHAGSASAHHAKTISIKGYAFPKVVTVKLDTKVTWKNSDPSAHTVTADKGSPFKVASKDVLGSKEYSFTFTKTGVLHYHCLYHPFMKGTIRVVAR